MSHYRMCRWHPAELEACPSPKFQYKKDDDFQVPYCTTCNRSPPIKELIPCLTKAWTPSHMPQDEAVGQMDLHWPESVFGKSHRPISHAPTQNSWKQYLHVEVDGHERSYELVDDTPLSPSQLRLMRLSTISSDEPVHVTLQTHTYADPAPPEFEAVSYTLGGENRSRQPDMPIYVGKQMDLMLLTPTCEAMLRFLSPYPGESSSLLWFDYLCINQEDMLERDHQMPRMAEIYGKCARVIVYLGADIVRRLDYPRQRPRYWMHEIIETDGISDRPTSISLQEILKREYFKRTWVIQELLFAETIIIPVEDCNIRAGLVAVNRLRESAKRWDWKESEAPWLQRTGTASAYSWNSRGSRSRSLWEVLRETWSLKVTDPRDKVFGILGLVNPDPKFKPDSTLSWISTFIGTCAYLIKRGHPELLFKARGASVNQLTWLPDPKDPTLWSSVTSTALGCEGIFRQRFAKECNSILLRLRTGRIGVLTGRIDLVSLRTHRDGYLQSSAHDLIAKLHSVSLCPTSGALNLKLGHLATLNEVPALLSAENKEGGDHHCSFSLAGDDGLLFLTTLNGPLDVLEVGDHLFLHISPYNRSSVLFALRSQGEMNSYILLFCCPCPDVLLFTADWNSSSGSGLQIVPDPNGLEGLDPTLSWFRSTFGKSLPVVLEECSGIHEINFVQTHKQKCPGNGLKDPLNYFCPKHNVMNVDVPWRSFREDICFVAFTPLSAQPGRLELTMRPHPAELVVLSQALVDDDAEDDESVSQHFDRAFISVLGRRFPTVKLSISDDNLVMQNLPPEWQISVDPGGTTQHRHKRIKRRSHTLPDFKPQGPLGCSPIHTCCWSPQEITLPIRNAKNQIRSQSVGYRRLSNLTSFRGRDELDHMNETQLLELSNSTDNRYDNIYSKVVWPCSQRIVDALGLQGDVKDVWIQ